jgi:hypothetical protein
MSNTSDAMAAFLARGGTVTQCGSSDKQAPTLRQLRRERDLECTDENPERAQERFGAARANGYSVSDSLDESR